MCRPWHSSSAIKVDPQWPMFTPGSQAMFDHAIQAAGRESTPTNPHELVSTPHELPAGPGFIENRALVAEESFIKVTPKYRTSEGHNFLISCLFSARPEATDSL